MSQKKQVTCEDVKGQTYSVSVDELKFRPTVHAIITKDNKVLLLKQWDGYDFPGGGVKLGETLDEALKREVKEETGLEVEIDKVTHAETSFFKLPFKGNFVHEVHLFFKCQITGGKLDDSLWGDQEKQYVKGFEWVGVEKLTSLKLLTVKNPEKLVNLLQNNE